MATNTYVALDTKTLTSNATSVVFTSINQGYTDLVLVCNSGQVTADTSTNFRVGTSNTIDTGSNYSDTALNGNGSAENSYRNTSNNRMIVAGSNSSSILDNFIFHIQNYSNTTTYKTVLSRANVPGFRVVATVSLWRNTAAINTLEIYGGSNLLSGSTFTLYGIATAPTVAAKATGGTITSDVSYTYHTFTSSGTFTPSQALSCDYLVVAGGGGGGYQRGGGGGAGGFRTSIGGSALSVTAQAYSITVGAGGAGDTNASGAGVNGSDSIFSTITSIGGGGGGSNSGAAANGGSGGGGGLNPSGATFGTGTAGQGSNGGATNTTQNSAGCAGGGGGAGAVGSNGSTSVSGNGGAGTASLISGSSITYAGGGGGGSLEASTAGSGGAGGGGNGGVAALGTAGTANTGGGGGGGGQNSNTGISYAGGTGGSGIVIIRYAN